MGRAGYCGPHPNFSFSSMGKCLSCLGNCQSAAILFFADLLVSIISGTARGLVDCIDFFTGSGHNTARKKIAWHPPRYTTAPVFRVARGEPGFFGEIDVQATLKKSTFPISPDTLIDTAREVVMSEFGTAQGNDGSCLADDFQFVAPIVGPLSKKEFIRVFGSFKLREAIPDLAYNSWFQVDPLEPNRVWWLSRDTGTHLGTLNFANGIPPTGKRVEMPPQAMSFLFNEQGEVYTLTVGYTMDKRIGNSNGLGAVLGILKAVDKPLSAPEGRALYNPSLKIEALERVGKAFEDAGRDPSNIKKKLS